MDDGRTTDGRTPDHGHPISSPCEPDGSGELIMVGTTIFRNKLKKKIRSLMLPEDHYMLINELVHEKTNNLGLPTRSNTNRDVQS